MKNRGFTLVELLATITILGILSSLAYVGVSHYLLDTKKKTYEVFEKDIEIGAENYLIEHSSKLPKVNETVIINVSKLTNELYVENLKDPINKSKNCNDNSYVIIKRNSNNINSDNFDIEYTACLKCSNYTSSSCLDDITGIKIIN